MRYLPAIISILALIAFVAAIAWADQRGPLIILGAILMVLASIVRRRFSAR